MNITELLLNLKWNNFTEEYETLLESSYKPIAELQKQQLIELRQMLLYSRKNVNYYENNKNYDLDVDKYDSILDLLNELPLLDRSLIRKETGRFIATNFKGKVIDMSTGGSTGEPLRYKMSYEDLKYSRLLKYRGYSYAGYSIGDSILILGGGSLIKKRSLFESVKSKLLNVKKVASYGINDSDFRSIFDMISQSKKMYIYGYASTIFLLASFFSSNNLSVKENTVMGVFVTSEVLTESQRNLIEKVFGNVVFNDYGANDGGVSAHECEAHNGLHLDMERSIIEVVDDNDRSLKEGYGRVVVTSLKNKAMPFIRYETGDYAEITFEKCTCGRETPRLLKILGRTTDYLYLNGSYIGSPVLTVLMGKLDLDFYQIIQKTHNCVLFKVYKNNGFNQKMRVDIKNHIEKSVKSYFREVDILFEFVEGLPSIKNKHKYIINEWLKERENA